MKNAKGNRHIKKEPFMTLRGHLKDDYYVILERFLTNDCFEHIITRMSDEHGEDSLNIDSAHAMLDGAIFRCEKDAENFLTKLIKHRYYNICRILADDTPGSKTKKCIGAIPKEEIEAERKYFRVMSINEMFKPYRLAAEIKENHEKEE